MSLISEALKKARQEAARQDSLRQGVPYAVGAVDPPSRRNPLLPVLAGLGAGCLVAALLFGIAWMGGLGPFAKPVQEAQVAQAPASAPAPALAITEPTVAAQEATPAPAPVVTETTPPAPAPPPAPEERPQPVETRPAPAPPVEQPVVRLEPQTAPPPAPAPAEEQPPAVLVPEPSPAPPTIQIQPTTPRPAPEGSGDLEEGKVYTGELPVPGGGSVKLNGIAFSQDQPVAVLDGRVMGPGEVIQGFTIVSIESGRVKLQGHGMTVFLSPK
ncbi:MAG TPA: hypothetical protein VHC97_26135 [Thermoanaerobaculia bacterium]|jgi:hypothetical protein|nr:hypothetical protein [Thermoanaerobaculia bacterium]